MNINEPWEASIDWAPDFPRGSHVFDSHGNEIATNVDGFQANLIAAAPDLLEGGNDQTAILRMAQKILTRYLMPDGIDAPQAITELLGLLDGPVQRSAQAKWDAAIKKAKGE